MPTEQECFLMKPTDLDLSSIFTNMKIIQNTILVIF